ncbi:type II secretion system F family protein [Streptomyces sp. NPDC049915]|uniref:type II secretion system F family protein n=1 Tax=Streptomyces sp. NPDC049915 TaxID=3155510 RepID=UPI00342E4FBC
MGETPWGVVQASWAAAAACLGMAAWLVGGDHFGARRARLVLAGGGAVAAGGLVTAGGVVTAGGMAAAAPPAWPDLAQELRRLRARWRPEWWAAVAGALLGLLGGSLLPVVAGAAGVPLLRRTRLAGAARRARDRQGDAVIALCAVLASEVRAGRQPGHALLSAARESGGLGGGRAAVLAAARFGGDVPAALATAARQPGADGLLGLAACWRVAMDQGAGLAAGLDRLQAALRAERDQRADLRAQLAGARSTAVLLAGLPGLGLALGSALGADPLRVLLHTGAGLGCLLVGGLLEAAGVWWALRIVRAAESV